MWDLTIYSLIEWHRNTMRHIIMFNCIGGVMLSVLVSSVVDRGFELQSYQTKHYKIGICCFSDKHTALRRKSKDWLVRNHDNVSIRKLLFQ